MPLINMVVVIVQMLLMRQTFAGEFILTHQDSLRHSNGSWHDGKIDELSYATSCAIGTNFSRGACTSEPATHAMEISALATIFNDLDGPNWKRKSGWLSGNPCRNFWHGIECDSNGKIVRLLLADNRLTGAIPSAIANLVELRELQLQSTSIPGYRNPDANEISGVVPSLVSCTKLQVLDLSGNRITALPFNLNENLMLEVVSAAYNQLLHIPPLSGLQRLRILQLSSNLIDDVFPATEICELVNIKFIDLGNNTLSGRFSTCMSTSIDPIVFDVSGPLPGNLPAGKGLLGQLPPEIMTNWKDINRGYLSLFGQTKMSGRIAQLCMDVRQCYRFMFATHEDLSWAEDPAAVPSVVYDTIALANSN